MLLLFVCCCGRSSSGLGGDEKVGDGDGVGVMQQEMVTQHVCPLLLSVLLMCGIVGEETSAR